MAETYEEMRARIKPERYEVKRIVTGMATMSRGLSRETYEEPRTYAYIWQRTPRRFIERVGLNASTMCLPDGHTTYGLDASDEEIVLAVIGDESVF